MLDENGSPVSEDQPSAGPGPVAGLRVIDASTLFAGPTIATLLADFGADVIKVEHPRGDGQRTMGWQHDGTSLMWTVLNRNKRCVTLDLHHPEGQELFRQLVDTADVLIENFRPGTLEKWGLGYDVLSERNPGLVMARVTAYGQTGPLSSEPGFGTIAEAMSGFAHINGHPGGPPTLPPFALGDTIAGLMGTSAVMFALHHRDHSPERRGQVIDLSIFEPLFWMLGPQISLYEKLGVVQERTGNRAPFTSPRNLYETADGRWVAISASAQSIAERLMRMVDAPHYVDYDWFADHTGRLDHIDELDEVVGAWIGARSTEAVLEAASEWEVAAFPVYSAEDIMTDPQYLARQSFCAVEDGNGDATTIQNVVPILSETPGNHRWLGPALGEHNDEVFAGELNVDAEHLRRLHADGVLASPEKAPQ